ncbi:MAG: hypothetical protein ACD_39C00154G0003 [uncultured bacterium]|nr:MAG: hypothetical protein ACD_39C00154G0003 [uncultured bacterium]
MRGLFAVPTENSAGSLYYRDIKIEQGKTHHWSAHDYLFKRNVFFEPTGHMDEISNSCTDSHPVIAGIGRTVTSQGNYSFEKRPPQIYCI